MEPKPQRRSVRAKQIHRTFGRSFTGTEAKPRSPERTELADGRSGPSLRLLCFHSSGGVGAAASLAVSCLRRLVRIKDLKRLRVRALHVRRDDVPAGAVNAYWSTAKQRCTVVYCSGGVVHACSSADADAEPADGPVPPARPPARSFSAAVEISRPAARWPHGRT